MHTLLHSHILLYHAVYIFYFKNITVQQFCSANKPSLPYHLYYQIWLVFKWISLKPTRAKILDKIGIHITIIYTIFDLYARDQHTHNTPWHYYVTNLHCISILGDKKWTEYWELVLLEIHTWLVNHQKSTETTTLPPKSTVRTHGSMRKSHKGVRYELLDQRERVRLKVKRIQL